MFIGGGRISGDVCLSDRHGLLKCNGAVVCGVCLGGRRVFSREKHAVACEQICMPRGGSRGWRFVRSQTHAIYVTCFIRGMSQSMHRGSVQFSRSFSRKPLEQTKYIFSRLFFALWTLLVCQSCFLVTVWYFVISLRLFAKKWWRQSKQPQYNTICVTGPLNAVAE